MENAVFLHLQREKAKLSNPYQINYWKDYSGNEVDFVIIQAEIKINSDCQIKFPSLGYQEFYRYTRNVS